MSCGGAGLYDSGISCPSIPGVAEVFERWRVAARVTSWTIDPNKLRLLMTSACPAVYGASRTRTCPVGAKAVVQSNTEYFDARARVCAGGGALKEFGSVEVANRGGVPSPESMAACSLGLISGSALRNEEDGQEAVGGRGDDSVWGRIRWRCAGDQGEDSRATLGLPAGCACAVLRATRLIESGDPPVTGRLRRDEFIDIAGILLIHSHLRARNRVLRTLPRRWLTSVLVHVLPGHAEHLMSLCGIANKPRILGGVIGGDVENGVAPA